MKGTTQHEIKTVRAGEWGDKDERYDSFRITAPTVVLFDSDAGGYNWQGFETWDEVREFCSRLNEAAGEAFGQPTYYVDNHNNIHTVYPPAKPNET